MKTVEVVLCGECKSYRAMQGVVESVRGGVCLVDAPTHISLVSPEHFCSFGIEKSPCEKAEDLS